MAFKHWLKNKRLSKGLTQKTISKEIGISEVSFCNFENGIKVPGVSSIKKLSDYFGTRTETIYRLVQFQNKTTLSKEKGNK